MASHDSTTGQWLILTPISECDWKVVQSTDSEFVAKLLLESCRAANRRTEFALQYPNGRLSSY